MKTYRFTVLRADGGLEKMSVPEMFDPFEICARLPHNLVFFHVPAKMAVFAGHEQVHGPAIVLTTAENGGTYYRVPQEPLVDERSAYYAYYNRLS